MDELNIKLWVIFERNDQCLYILKKEVDKGVNWILCRSLSFTILFSPNLLKSIQLNIRFEYVSAKPSTKIKSDVMAVILKKKVTLFTDTCKYFAYGIDWCSPLSPLSHDLIFFFHIFPIQLCTLKTLLLSWWSSSIQSVNVLS